MGNVALAVTSALAAQGARWGGGGGWEGPSGRNELYDGEERGRAVWRTQKLLGTSVVVFGGSGRC